MLRFAVRCLRRHWRGNCDPALVPSMLPGRFRLIGVALCLAWGGTALSAQTGEFVESARSGARRAGVDAPRPVAWVGVVNITALNGGVQKTSGCDGCPDASAVSIETIDGNGRLEWTAPEVQTLRIVGISPNATPTTAADIPFAIRLQSGIAEVRELGAYKADVRFAAGDAFGIAVEKGVVRYLKNGSIFYTSAVMADEALHAHAVIFGLNGAISQVGITGSTAAVTTPIR
jgi:hypothetical protein